MVEDDISRKPSPLSPELQTALRVVARNIVREVDMAKAELRAELEVLRKYVAANQERNSR